MSIMEKIQDMIGVTPSYTDEEREKVRSDARRKAKAEWFKNILDHHLEIDKAFAKVKVASSTSARAAAQKKLALILTGHSIAEEAIVYPFMKMDTSSMDATHSYMEQSTAKIQMVALDSIPNKMSKKYNDKLEEIRSAVTHHMIEEEKDYFPELQKKATTAHNKKITQHYLMEFKRYMHNSAA